MLSVCKMHVLHVFHARCALNFIMFSKEVLRLSAKKLRSSFFARKRLSEYIHKNMPLNTFSHGAPQKSCRGTLGSYFAGKYEIHQYFPTKTSPARLWARCSFSRMTTPIQTRSTPTNFQLGARFAMDIDAFLNISFQSIFSIHLLTSINLKMLITIWKLIFEWIFLVLAVRFGPKCIWCLYLSPGFTKSKPLQSRSPKSPPIRPPTPHRRVERRAGAVTS